MRDMQAGGNEERICGMGVGGVYVGVWKRVGKEWGLKI